MNSTIAFQSACVPQSPIITYIITTYKQCKFLSSAIHSVASQNDNENDYEILVISNNPNIDFAELIELYSDEPIVFYVNERNYGQVGNMNQAAFLAKGKYIAYVHDDDMLLPNYYSAMKEYLKKDIYDCILPSYYLMGEKYKFDFAHRIADVLFAFRYIYRGRMTPLDADAFEKAAEDVYGAPSCGAVFRKSALVEYGLFRDERGAAWDFYNFREFSKQYNVNRLHSYLGIRRTDTGMSSNPKVQRDFFDDWKKTIEEECSKHSFLYRNREHCLYRKKTWRYALFRIRKNIITYIYNYDREMGVTRALFQEYGGGEAE